MKVEVELPDLPGNMEYVPESLHADMPLTCRGFGCRRDIRVTASFGVIEKEPPYPAPEGYEFTGERRPPKQGEFFRTELNCGHETPRGVAALWDFPVEEPKWILRKKPTYTEAVKATGWKWPEDLHPKYGFLTDSSQYQEAHVQRPLFDGEVWSDGLERTELDVDFEWPERRGYSWSECLLFRDDFI